MRPVYHYAIILAAVVLFVVSAAVVFNASTVDTQPIVEIREPVQPVLNASVTVLVREDRLDVVVNRSNRSVHNPTIYLGNHVTLQNTLNRPATVYVQPSTKDAPYTIRLEAAGMSGAYTTFYNVNRPVNYTFHVNTTGVDVARIYVVPRPAMTGDARDKA